MMLVYTENVLLKKLLIMCFYVAGVVPEQESKVEEKGEHKERPRTACPQRSPHHVFRRTYQRRGAPSSRTGASRKEEEETRRTQQKDGGTQKEGFERRYAM